MERIIAANFGSVDGTFVGAAVTSYFEVLRHRSAWHSTAVTHSAGREVLHETLRRAQSFAETWRSQGSSFSIVQHPALRLASRGGPDVIVRGFNHRPLENWEESLVGRAAPPQPMSSALAALAAEDNWMPSFFESRIEHLFLEFYSVPDEARAPDLTRKSVLKRWGSMSAGLDCLDWWPRDGDRAARTWFALAEALNASV